MAKHTGVDDGADTGAVQAQTEVEHQSLVVDYNQSAADYPADTSIVDLFVAQAARTPGDEAIRLGDRALSYRELNERASQIAAGLRAMGVAPRHLVVLCMEHSIEVVAAILGVLKAGAAYVPLDPEIPAERLALLLRDVAEGQGGAAPVVVTQPHRADRVPAGSARVMTLDATFASVARFPVSVPDAVVGANDPAYVIYTSGSTGTPKGVVIGHRSLVNYIWWASAQYAQGERLTWPLFSSLAFDLTVTSIFTPLVTGGRIVVYSEDAGGHSMVIFKVIQDGVADIVKLTPAHLAMIREKDLGRTRIRRLIVGGEDFKTEVARGTAEAFGRPVEIFNEYGPTEATVGCMIHRFDPGKDRAPSVPIGRPAANTRVYVLDERLTPVPTGVVGQMYLAGDGLAIGYFNRPELTAQSFVTAADPRQLRPNAAGATPATERLYKTGDLARWTVDGRLEFLGRADHQVKLGGFRIELGEIEARLLKHGDIKDCVVAVVNSAAAKPKTTVTHCSACGLASDYPGSTFDADGVCNMCRAYATYVDRAQVYFKTTDDFRKIVAEMKAARTGEYDCIVLLSGGKDSTYMLYQLRALDLKILTFTLDNGFISEEAKANIRRTVQALGVDHIFGTTPHMNEIFVDSLKRFSNVCNGCFKTVYTLGTNLAHEKGIRYIITGLSRGQFFETRLTEDVFRRPDLNAEKLDEIVLEARKAYHQRSDAVASRLEVDVFRDEGIFKEIQFVDFYRYWSVSLEDLYAFLDTHAAWTRPTDTGRSTNCLINDLGIYLHKKQRGFHNYSLPYSWDVRLGQKTRAESMEELDDAIDETRVKQLMAEIGYTEPAPNQGVDRLVAYYVADQTFTASDLRAHLAVQLPEYMLPTHFVRLESLPLTPNGKVDRKALPAPTAEHTQPPADAADGPRTETEKALAAIWAELLNVERVGLHDEFFELGGHSLLAISAVSRIRDVFGVDIPLEVMFETPTIAGLAKALADARG
jgi:amino acid adenylation domain-containing protein